MGLPALLILAVLRAPPGSPPGSRAGASAPRDAAGVAPVGLLLAQLLVVLAATRCCGVAVRRMGQPQVVGEMLAGILLGPSFLGLVAPAAYASLFPPGSLGALGSLSQVGMVLFMFLVGLELDTEALRARGETAILTSHASIVVPFALGVLIASPLYARFAPAGVSFVAFALFLGAAMSVTAFPVLARILAERGLLRTPLGALATAAAAVDDVTAWTLLAAITVMTRAGSAGMSLLVTLAGIALFVAAALSLRRPLRRATSAAFERSGRLTHDQVAVLVGAALLGALATEAIGVHALFGAFFVGLMLARERRVAAALRDRLEDPLVVVLLPLYFAFTGLRARLGLLLDAEAFGFTLLVLLVAVAGKLLGSALTARLAGTPWRDALALGVLLNTRGLMALVILNVGLDLGVLSPALYSMMVLMALLTTLMTTPLLGWLGIAREPATPPAAP